MKEIKFLTDYRPPAEAEVNTAMDFDKLVNHYHYSEIIKARRYRLIKVGMIVLSITIVIVAVLLIVNRNNKNKEVEKNSIHSEVDLRKSADPSILMNDIKSDSVERRSIETGIIEKSKIKETPVLKSAIDKEKKQIEFKEELHSEKKIIVEQMNVDSIDRVNKSIIQKISPARESSQKVLHDELEE